MNDRETPNPYQPPTSGLGSVIAAETDWASLSDQRIAFQAALTEQDVKRLFPGSMPSSLIIGITILALLMLSMGSLSRGLLLMLIAVLALLLGVRLRLNGSLALRQSPRLLEPVSGYITPEGFFTSSDGCEGYSRWEDIHSIKTTKRAVLFSGENWRLVSMILPWESFDHPAAAQQALASIIQQRKSVPPIAIGDPRLSEEPPDAALFPASGPHVSYDGNVTFGEIAETAPGKKMRRNMARWVPICIATLLVGFCTLLGGLTWFLLVGVPLSVFASVILFLFSRHPLLRRRADQVAFRSRGWFSASGFFLHSRTGQSKRQWRSVDHQWHDTSTLCICLPGVSEGWFFFSKNQFASDVDFAQACQWAETGLSIIGEEA